MRERFLDPEAFAAFCEGFTTEMDLRRREHAAQRAAARRELASVEQEMQRLVQAIKEGVSALIVNSEFKHLEAKKAALERSTSELPLAALQPNMADIYRRKVAALASELQEDAARDAARQTLRSLLESITVPPGNELLQVRGNVATMLAAAAGQDVPGHSAVANVGCGGGI